jgi:hypothetical protein
MVLANPSDVLYFDQKQVHVWPLIQVCSMYRVGQNHRYTVYIQYFRQGNHQIYGKKNIRCTYTVRPTLSMYEANRLPYRTTEPISGASLCAKLYQKHARTW